MLLKRFASRAKGGEVYTWQFRRNARPFEANVRNASVEAQFYGDADNGIEQGLGRIESRHAVVLDEVLKGRDPRDFADELRQLLWTLAVRTSNFRHNVGDLFRNGIDELADQVDVPTATRMISEHLKNEFDTMLDETIAKLPAVQARAFRISLERRPALRDKFRRLIAMQVEGDNYAFAVQALLHLAQKTIDTDALSETSHVRALQRLGERGYVPESFRPEHWQTLRVPARSVILGDGACFAVGDSGPGHMLRFGQDWSEVYLPISHDTVLIASRVDAPPRLKIEQINTASASLSYDQFFAAENGVEEQSLAQIIRTRASTLSLPEIQRIVREMLAGYPPLQGGSRPAT